MISNGVPPQQLGPEDFGWALSISKAISGPLTYLLCKGSTFPRQNRASGEAGDQRLVAAAWHAELYRCADPLNFQWRLAREWLMCNSSAARPPNLSILVST